MPLLRAQSTKPGLAGILGKLTRIRNEAEMGGGDGAKCFEMVFSRDLCRSRLSPLTAPKRDIRAQTLPPATNAKTTQYRATRGGMNVFP